MIQCCRCGSPVTMSDAEKVERYEFALRKIVTITDGGKAWTPEAKAHYEAISALRDTGAKQ